MKLFWKFFLVFLCLCLFLAFPVVGVNVHLEYDWWEPSVVRNMPPKVFTSCAACHETLAGGATHPGARKICEDCHLSGGSGSFVFYSFSNLYRVFNYSSPMVFYHIADPNSVDVSYVYGDSFFEVSDQSNVFGGASRSKCFGWNPDTGEGTCHGISSNNPVDGYYAFNLTYDPTREDPYRFAMEVERLPDSSDCLYCHRQSDSSVVLAWGGAGQVGVDHFDSTSNDLCFECHVDSSVSFVSFHNMGPVPEVVFINQPSPTPTPPPTIPPTLFPPTTVTTVSTTSTSSTSTSSTTSVVVSPTTTQAPTATTGILMTTSTTFFSLPTTTSSTLSTIGTEGPSHTVPGETRGPIEGVSSGGFTSVGIFILIIVVVLAAALLYWFRLRGKEGGESSE